MLSVETMLGIARPPAEVFEALVDPTKMARYFISSGSARMQAGTTVVWRWEDHHAELPIEVLAATPDRSIRFKWSASGEATTVDVELEREANGGTTVKVRESGWLKDDAGIGRYGQQMQGWVHMLTCLKAYLEHGINLREDRPR